MDGNNNAAKSADRAIGAHVRSIRQTRGLSLRDVEAAARDKGIVGLTINKLSELENGKRKWSTVYADRIARVLGVSFSAVWIGGCAGMVPGERQAA